MGCERPFWCSLTLFIHSQVFQDSYLFWGVSLLNRRNNVEFFGLKLFVRETGAEDVYLKVICCGICHTDIHQIKNDLGMSNYPMVPG